MKTTLCQYELIDIIIDLQDRGFDHDFTIDHEHILCLQYNEMIPPDDFDILETHLCTNNVDCRGNYILYGIQLKHYNIKGILMSNHKTYNYGLSLHLWQKFNNEIVKSLQKLQPLIQGSFKHN